MGGEEIISQIISETLETVNRTEKCKNEDCYKPEFYLLGHNPSAGGFQTNNHNSILCRYCHGKDLTWATCCPSACVPSIST